MIVAHVVGAALEQGRGHRNLERVAHRRQVAVIELVLKRLGTRRDDDLAGREQSGHEIGEGFAGAGARPADRRWCFRRSLSRASRIGAADSRPRTASTAAAWWRTSTAKHSVSSSRITPGRKARWASE